MNTDAELLAGALAWEPLKGLTATEIAMKFQDARLDAQRVKMRAALDLAMRDAWKKFAQEYTCPSP